MGGNILFLIDSIANSLILHSLIISGIYLYYPTICNKKKTRNVQDIFEVVNFCYVIRHQEY